LHPKRSLILGSCDVVKPISLAIAVIFVSICVPIFAVVLLVEGKLNRRLAAQNDEPSHHLRRG
jgi:hypothetical protein